MYNPWAKGKNSESLFKFDPKTTGLYTFRWNRPYMAINDLYCKITKALDDKHHIPGIFLDLSKTFDTLNHDILLNKLIGLKLVSSNMNMQV